MTGPIDLGRIRRALTRAGASELDRPRRAAVALVLAPAQAVRAQAETSLAVLLVRRAERAGDPWSGHMALPGGHAAPDDEDLLQTARRETLEEVGVDLASAELLGRLDDVSPMRSSEVVVRPFVFWAAEPGVVTLSHELAEALWVPLDALVGSALRATREVDVRGARLRVPAYVVDDRVVWGMTFHLLDGFVARLLAAE